jgi:ribosomal 30S subunit maturation factor RimM
MEDYINIGSLVATFGVKGDIVLSHHLGTNPELAKVEEVLQQRGTDKQKAPSKILKQYKSQPTIKRYWTS